MDNEKFCHACQKMVLLTNFQKRKTTRDGLKHQCKDCVSEYNKDRNHMIQGYLADSRVKKIPWEEKHKVPYYKWLRWLKKHTDMTPKELCRTSYSKYLKQCEDEIAGAGFEPTTSGL